MECGNTGKLEGALARLFHSRRKLLINTGASARCQDTPSTGELFQQFPKSRGKPLLKTEDCSLITDHSITGRSGRATYFFDLCALTSSTRVTCRMASSLSGPTAYGDPFAALPMNIRAPYTHANSGCGTMWLEPSERKSLKGRKGFWPSSSLIRCGVIISCSRSHVARLHHASGWRKVK